MPAPRRQVTSGCTSPVEQLGGYFLIEANGPAAGLALIDALLARGELDDYQHAHSARADLLRRLGRNDDARAAYTRGLALAAQEPERRFLERRIAELSV